MLEDGGETFRSKVGSRPGDEPLPVAHALWHCETAFARAKYVPARWPLHRPLLSAMHVLAARAAHRFSPCSAKPSDYQRIWVFTNDDDPCRGDNAAIKHAVKKAKVRRGSVQATTAARSRVCDSSFSVAGLH